MEITKHKKVLITNSILLAIVFCFMMLLVLNPTRYYGFQKFNQIMIAFSLLSFAFLGITLFEFKAAKIVLTVIAFAQIIWSFFLFSGFTDMIGHGSRSQNDRAYGSQLIIFGIFGVIFVFLLMISYVLYAISFTTSKPKKGLYITAFVFSLVFLGSMFFPAFMSFSIQDRIDINRNFAIYSIWGMLAIHFCYVFGIITYQNHKVKITRKRKGSVDDIKPKLDKLEALRRSGHLSEAEYQDHRNRIIDN